MKKCCFLLFLLSFAYVSMARSPRETLAEFQQEPIQKYRGFISQNLSYDPVRPMDFFMYDDDQKHEYLLKIFNHYSGLGFKSAFDLPVIPEDFINNFYKDNIDLYPISESWDLDALNQIKIDFPRLREADIHEFSAYIRTYYERVFEHDVLKTYAQFADYDLDKYGNSRLGKYNLCDEEQSFLIAHFLQAEAIIKATEDTQQWVTEMYDAAQMNTDNIKANAVKHAMWNYRIAQRIGDMWLYSRKKGREIAKKFTDIHEECGNGSAESTEMDYHNNYVGRRLHEIHSSYDKAGLINAFWGYVANARCARAQVSSIRAVPSGTLVYTHDYLGSIGNTTPCLIIDACMYYNQSSFTAPAVIELSANCSFAKAGTSIVNYHWTISNFETGISFTKSGRNPAPFSITQAGSYDVILTVTSSQSGVTDTAFQIINVEDTSDDCSYYRDCIAVE